MRTTLGLLLVVILAAGCKEAAPAKAKVEQRQSWPLDQAPAQLQPAVARATASFAALQQSLTQRLQAAMAQGGPAAAVDVCSTEAQPLTATAAEQQGLQMGRTSHKLRNEKNAPRPWAAAYVGEHAGKKASEVPGRVFQLGDRVGVLKPIPTGALCLTCHGQNVAPELQQVIAAKYPNDQARGFAEGELRGFFWAEVTPTQAR